MRLNSLRRRGRIYIKPSGLEGRGGGFTNNLEKCVLNVYYEGDGGYIKTRGGMAEGEVGWDIPLSGYCNVKFVKVQFMILEHMLLG